MTKSSKLESPSYMELRLDLEGKQVALFLRVPTFWDAVNSQWIGCLKLPSGKMLKGQGKTSFDLQNSFNIELHKAFTDKEMQDETFAMFKPVEYWEIK